jgi:hypothetical protein
MSAGIRANARTVGISLQVLSVLTLFGTFYATYEVAKLGSNLGVGASNDPAPWIVFVAGVVISLVIAGLGYALAILCAIYDRQVRRPEQKGQQAFPVAATSRDNPSWPGNTKPPVLATKTTKTTKTTTPTPSAPSMQATVETTVPDSPHTQANQKSELWKWLTRERHVFKESSQSSRPVT